jgi:hypothetical protein
MTPLVAMQMKITVHPGPNAQFGGFHDGFRKLAYQSPTSVNRPPVMATTLTEAIATRMTTPCSENMTLPF